MYIYHMFAATSAEIETELENTFMEKQTFLYMKCSVFFVLSKIHVVHSSILPWAFPIYDVLILFFGVTIHEYNNKT